MGSGAVEKGLAALKIETGKELAKTRLGISSLELHFKGPLKSIMQITEKWDTHTKSFLQPLDFASSAGVLPP